VSDFLSSAYDDWLKRRTDFQPGIAADDPEAIKQGWQRDKVRGRDPSGSPEPVIHLSKRKLKLPK
jgi:hypothetical protein